MSLRTLFCIYLSFVALCTTAPAVFAQAANSEPAQILQLHPTIALGDSSLAVKTSASTCAILQASPLPSSHPSDVLEGVGNTAGGKSATPAGAPVVGQAGGISLGSSEASQFSDSSASLSAPALRGEPAQAVSAPTSLSPGALGKKPSVIGVVMRSAAETLQRNFSMPGYNPPVTAPLFRRAPPAPLDPVFPSTEFIGTNGQAPMGVNDNNGAVYPLEKMLWKTCPIMAKYRIRAYGWLNPGYNYGTSRHSNYPMSYIVAARQLHWDQIVMRFERVPDTVQQKHVDWGFRFTSLYGEDYRFTLSKGWVSNQLLKNNYLTGWDPVECYGELYVPKIGERRLFDGLLVRVGRYVSCPDIEAQLAPDNYLFTHSIMFTVDTYTQTGIQNWLQLNKYWNVMLGFHGGADTAPWTNSTVPTAQFLVRWTGKGNKDSIYAGINDLNGLPFRNPMPGQKGKDNLQQVNFNWTHVFNKRCHTVTEVYYLWSRNALVGGTVNNGPLRPYGGGGGPGAYLPGYSHAIGMVNYTLFKVSDKDYICLRPLDFLSDRRGWRTGYPTEYMSGTIGWTHRFSDTLCIRPEFRIERSLRNQVTPYDNGKKLGQTTFACDIIQRF
ncbi:MAG: outer membrane beta-barrel protein [Cyanobacteria bacterium REEB67]|nr:outer membrane beta-barrel protein [Cyanobacteria bacterium REEB67]